MNTTLPPGPASRKPKTKFLVVCGVTKTSDAWFFGNFLGFTRALKLLGVDEDFWSSFPLREYFDEGFYDSIRFGRQGPSNPTNDGKALEVFTKRDFEHRVAFWKHYNWNKQAQLVPDILNHVGNISKNLVCGDIFNMILIGHENEDGTSIGGNILKADTLAEALGRFSPGVRVNIVVQFCDSDVFADKIQARDQRERFVHTSSHIRQPSYPEKRSPSGRFRNSHFSGAFLQSLGFAVNPGASDWTLQEHLKWVEQEGKGSPSNPAEKADPQHYINEIALITRFVHILFTDYVDRTFSQATNAARHVLTPTPPTTTDLSIGPTAVPTESLQSAVDLISYEVELAHGHGGEKDAGLDSSTTSSKWAYDTSRISEEKCRQHVAIQLKALRWRFRIQEQFYLTMEGLAKKDLIEPQLALSIPIQWTQVSPDVGYIHYILKGFAFAQECADLDSAIPYHGLFEAPIRWLAVLIARTCTNFEGTLSYIQTAGLLGKYDTSRLDSLPTVEIRINPQQMASKSDDGYIPQIGFWLPQGLSSMGDISSAWWVRYSKVSRLYEDCFGVGSWGRLWSDCK